LVRRTGGRRRHCVALDRFAAALGTRSPGTVLEERPPAHDYAASPM
jgi:hypothetical protein